MAYLMIFSVDLHLSLPEVNQELVAAVHIAYILQSEELDLSLQTVTGKRAWILV
jgi:hypothetical protein